MINRFAQEIINLEQIMIWFDSLDLESKMNSITKARIFLEQSHPTEEIIKAGIQTVPLKQTITPIVLFKTNNFKNAIHKIRSLPENENRKVFVTLISIFKISDTRRREFRCKNGCSHEWHNLESLIN